KPVSEEVFKAYSRLYAYDKIELNAKVEETETSPHWRYEKVTFAAAYGGERLAAHVFLPRNAAPPFQAVFYFPGGGGQLLERFESSMIENDQDFLPKTGRVFVYPIFKGTFERKDGLHFGGKPPGAWRDHVIMWSKDLARTLDYLETRNDIDAT